MLNRLLGIIYILINKGTVTAAELAERFEVSVRTIYRDIETLSMADIPVYTQRGKSGGICLMEQFVLNKMLVTQEEQQQILVALASIDQTLDGDKSKILNKLKDFFRIEPENWLTIDFSDWSNRRQDLFLVLKNAILNHQVLLFDYYGRNSQIKNRTVEPLRLLFKEYTWYMEAYCRERKAIRLFKIIRMKRVNITGEQFVPVNHQEEVPLQMDSNLDNNLKKVVLSIHKSEAYRVYDRFEEEEITVQKDGNFLVETKCMEDGWIFEVILSFGETLKVLEPESIQSEVRRRLSSALEQYEKIF